jgi:hypothetical protein
MHRAWAPPAGGRCLVDILVKPAVEQIPLTAACRPLGRIANPVLVPYGPSNHPLRLNPNHSPSWQGWANFEPCVAQILLITQVLKRRIGLKACCARVLTLWYGSALLYGSGCRQMRAQTIVARFSSADPFGSLDVSSPSGSIKHRAAALGGRAK